MPRLYFPLATYCLLLSSFVFSVKGDPTLSAPLPVHKVQITDPALGQKITAAGKQLVTDYGSFQLYNLPSLSPELLADPGTQVRDDYNIITLKSGALDTTQPEVQAMRKSLGAFLGK